jgi:hypothetical protein
MISVQWSEYRRDECRLFGDYLLPFKGPSRAEPRADGVYGVQTPCKLMRTISDVISVARVTTKTALLLWLVME